MSKVTFPSETVDLEKEIVPVVKALLRSGLPADFVHNCVHVSGFQRFGGGIKARLVGGLRIDVNAAIKLEDRTLEGHRRIMEVVNAGRIKVFPGVLDLVHLDDDRSVLLMEQLLGYETLLESVFTKDTNLTDIDFLVEKTFAALKAMWREGERRRDRLTCITTRTETLIESLRRKLDKVFREEPLLVDVMTGEGTVNGQAMESVSTLLQRTEESMASLGAVPNVLCHGDFHWRNVMSRKTSRGTSLRLIDPNPAVGFADPALDLGMLYHWAEPAGWAQINASRHCRSEWRPRHYDFQVTTADLPAYRGLA